MRRILLPLLLLAGLTAATTPTPAQASASTCATHQLALVQWSISQDSISGLWDFQCGGANNDDWIITYGVQYWTGSSWLEPNCDNGQLCEAHRPTSGWYTGGTRHSGTFTFNPAVQIDCRTWRVHAQVNFKSTVVTQWNSSNYAIGGC